MFYTFPFYLLFDLLYKIDIIIFFILLYKTYEPYETRRHANHIPHVKSLAFKTDSRIHRHFNTVRATRSRHCERPPRSLF